MVTIKAGYKEALRTALEDGTPCLVGTVSAENTPNISPKGSVIVYDEGHLAYWERAHRGAAANVQANPNVVVYYRNPARADLLPQGAALRFFGTVSVVADEAVKNDVYDRIPEREQKPDPDRKGFAVMMKVDRITNLRGEDL